VIQEANCPPFAIKERCLVESPIVVSVCLIGIVSMLIAIIWAPVSAFRKYKVTRAQWPLAHLLWLGELASVEIFSFGILCAWIGLLISQDRSVHSPSVRDEINGSLYVAAAILGSFGFIALAFVDQVLINGARRKYGYDLHAPQP
jgi:hypothetical protein